MMMLLKGGDQHRSVMAIASDPVALHQAVRRAAAAYADDISRALRWFAQKHAGEPAERIEHILRAEIASLDDREYIRFAESIAVGRTPEIRFIGNQPI